MTPSAVCGTIDSTLRSSSPAKSAFYGSSSGTGSVGCSAGFGCLSGLATPKSRSLASKCWRTRAALMDTTMRRDRAVLIARRIRTLRPSSCWIGLKPADPDRFSDTHLRTLQRRVQQWRAIMAKKLVYATAGEPMAGPAAMPELALVGRDPRC